MRSPPIRPAGQIALTFSLLQARPAFAYQRIAVEATRLQNLGMSAVTIAKSLGVTDKTVVKAISWVRLTTVSSHSATKWLGGARAIRQRLDWAGSVGTNRGERI